MNGLTDNIYHDLIRTRDFNAVKFVIQYGDYISDDIEKRFPTLGLQIKLNFWEWVAAYPFNMTTSPPTVQSVIESEYKKVLPYLLHQVEVNRIVPTEVYADASYGNNSSYAAALMVMPRQTLLELLSSGIVGNKNISSGLLSHYLGYIRGDIKKDLDDGYKMLEKDLDVFLKNIVINNPILFMRLSLNKELSEVLKLKEREIFSIEGGVGVNLLEQVWINVIKKLNVDGKLGMGKNIFGKDELHKLLDVFLSMHHDSIDFSKNIGLLSSTKKMNHRYIRDENPKQQNILFASLQSEKHAILLSKLLSKHLSAEKIDSSLKNNLFVDYMDINFTETITDRVRKELKVRESNITYSDKTPTRLFYFFNNPKKILEIVENNTANLLDKDANGDFFILPLLKNKSDVQIAYDIINNILNKSEFSLDEREDFLFYCIEKSASNYNEKLYRMLFEEWKIRFDSNDKLAVLLGSVLEGCIESLESCRYRTLNFINTLIDDGAKPLDSRGDLLYVLFDAKLAYFERDMPKFKNIFKRISDFYDVPPIVMAEHIMLKLSEGQFLSGLQQSYGIDNFLYDNLKRCEDKDIGLIEHSFVKLFEDDVLSSGGKYRRLLHDDSIFKLNKVLEIYSTVSVQTQDKIWGGICKKAFNLFKGLKYSNEMIKSLATLSRHTSFISELNGKYLLDIKDIMLVRKPVDWKSDVALVESILLNIELNNRPINNSTIKKLKI